MDQAARKYRVSRALIKAIILAESGFRPDAHRDEPALGDASRGLMQMLLSTARALGFNGPPEELYRPDVAIEYGTRYLALLLEQFRSERLAVAAYNCGPEHIARLCVRYGRSYRAIEPFLPAITRAYVPCVAAYQEQFARYDRERSLLLG